MNAVLNYKFARGPYSFTFILFLYINIFERDRDTRLSANLSLFLIVPLYALVAFQKPIEIPPLFSKDNRETISNFNKCERTPV